MSDILIVESRVREMLKQAPNAKKISAEAMAWVNARTEAAVRECMEFGSLTPGGKFMPPSSKLAPQPAYSDPLSLAGKPPEKMCARAKDGLSENGGEHKPMVFGLVRVNDKESHVELAAGVLQITIVDEREIAANAGNPEHDTFFNVLCDELREFAMVSKHGQYAREADELEKRHADGKKSAKRAAPAQAAAQASNPKRKTKP